MFVCPRCGKGMSEFQAAEGMCRHCIAEEEDIAYRRWLGEKKVAGEVLLLPPPEGLPNGEGEGQSV